MLEQRTFEHGDTVSGAGAVVVDGTRPYFCPSGYALPAQVTDNAVALHGPVADDLVRVIVGDEQIPGEAAWFSVTGTWRDGTIELQQFAGLDKPPVTEATSMQTAPCDPPDGGWRGSSNLSREVTTAERALWDAKLLLAKQRLDVGEGLQIFVFLAADVAAVTDTLRSVHGRSICIIQSHWSAQQIEDAMRALTSDSLWQNVVYGVGQNIGPDGQLRVNVSVLRATAEFENWLADRPDGLVVVHYALEKHTDVERLFTSVTE